MRVMAATYTLAARTNKKAKVVWVVDWEMGARYEDLFQPIDHIPVDTYWWKGAEREGNLIERAWASYYSVSDRRIIRWTNQQLRRLEFDFVVANDQAKRGLAAREIQAVQEAEKVLFTTHHDFIKPEVEYSELFNLQPELKRLVDAAAHDITDQTIGVHIRRGDHGRAIRQSPEEAFRRAIEKKIEENPDVTFFLATDSAETKQRLQDEFGSYILTNDVPLTRENASGLQGAVIDLYCLARTQKIFGSCVSTFSSTAAKIGDIPLVRISAKRIESNLVKTT
jgi:hypothetical protein